MPETGETYVIIIIIMWTIRVLDLRNAMVGCHIFREDIQFL